MATVNPQDLLQAAMAAGGSSAAAGAPTFATSATGTTPADAASQLSQTLPGLSQGAQATGATGGADTGGVGTQGVANVDLSSLIGSGSDLSQDPNAIQQMTQLLNDPSTPPDQKAEIRMRLQLAALASLAQNPTGTPQAQAQGA